MYSGGSEVTLAGQDIDWHDIPFNAADFTASGTMTWTPAGGVSLNRYALLGRNTMLWELSLGTSVLAGTPSNTLYIRVPCGKLARNVGAELFSGFIGLNPYEQLFAYWADSQRLAISRMATNAFPAASGAGGQLYFHLWFEVT